MLSFFGDAPDKPSTSKGAIVSRVTVKRPVQSAGTRPPITQKSISNGKLVNHRDGALKSAIKPSSTFPTTSKTDGSNLSKTSSNNLNKHLKSHIASIPVSRNATPPSPARKRKAANMYEPVRPESESESSSLDDDDDSLNDSGKKRKRVGSSMPAGIDEGIGREVFCLEKVDMRGEWRRGWGAFEDCESLVRGRDGKMLDKYEAYFLQEGFAKQEPLPSVELQYPARGCREKFILLKPNSPREYSPVDELLRALEAIVKHYIPPSHYHTFGHFSDPLRDDLLPASNIPSRFQSPLPNTLATPPPDTTPVSVEDSIARAIEKSLARNIRDGPGFVKAMERFNCAMVDLQNSGEMEKWLSTSQRGITKREWSDLVETVHEQAYNRVVGPFSNELEHHPKHTDQVANAITEKEDAYGELRHNFMSKIIEQTKLGPESVFVDLGSGVGNCVLQAALQAGCRSYGFELLPVPAKCARLQVAEVQRRWAMWGLKGNLKVETHEGDFRSHPEVAKRLGEADVVLVNNEVFPSSLNHDLTNQFLDLKEGAMIVSLKPFIHEGFRIKENNCGSFSALLRSTTHTYNQGWVSWKGESGKYHVQTIDRSMVKRFMEGLAGGSRGRS